MTTTTVTNASPIATEAARSLFPSYDRSRHYGALGFCGNGVLAYHADMIEMALRADSVPMIAETVARGWLAPSCRAFDNSHVIDYCQMRGAKLVAAYLRAMGWPERRTR
jgi:hypothetical protein